MKHQAKEQALGMRETSPVRSALEQTALEQTALEQTALEQTALE